MANQYGIPRDVEARIRRRDHPNCIYCRKTITAFSIAGKNRSDMATIEHFREEGPFYWKDGLKEEDLGICCWSCNSSRGTKPLSYWFKERYCVDRSINENTVAEPIRAFIRKIKR